MMYPNLFEKVYIEGELPEVEGEEPTPEEQPKVSRVDQLKAALAARSGGVVTAPAEAFVSPLRMLAEGKKLPEDLTPEQISTAIEEARAKLESAPEGAAWKEKLQKTMDMLADESMRREADAASKAVEGTVVNG